MALRRGIVLYALQPHLLCGLHLSSDERETREILVHFAKHVWRNWLAVMGTQRLEAPLRPSQFRIEASDTKPHQSGLQPTNRARDGRLDRPVMRIGLMTCLDGDRTGESQVSFMVAKTKTV